MLSLTRAFPGGIWKWNPALQKHRRSNRASGITKYIYSDRDWTSTCSLCIALLRPQKTTAAAPPPKSELADVGTGVNYRLPTAPIREGLCRDRMAHVDIISAQITVYIIFLARAPERICHCGCTPGGSKPASYQKWDEYVSYKPGAWYTNCASVEHGAPQIYSSAKWAFRVIVFLCANKNIIFL